MLGSGEAAGGKLGREGIGRRRERGRLPAVSGQQFACLGQGQAVDQRHRQGSVANDIRRRQRDDHRVAFGQHDVGGRARQHLAAPDPQTVGARAAQVADRGAIGLQRRGERQQIRAVEEPNPSTRHDAGAAGHRAEPGDEADRGQRAERLLADGRPARACDRPPRADRGATLRCRQ